MLDMLDEIRQRLIDSDITPHDLRIALEIIDQVEKEQSENNQSS